MIFDVKEYFKVGYVSNIFSLIQRIRIFVRKGDGMLKDYVKLILLLINFSFRICFRDLIKYYRS